MTCLQVRWLTLTMSDTSSDLEKFVKALWPEIPSGHRLLFWGAPSKGSRWTDTITPDLLAMLQAWGEKENVYIGCATRGADLGPTLRGDRGDCLAIPGVWLDIDYGKEHKKPNLPQTEDDAKALIESMGLPPSIIIHSGRGLQAWWLFREPWIFDSEEEKGKAETLTKGWSSTLKVRAKERGWDSDMVGDLPRVMRVPGLWNRKGVPRRTRLLTCTELRYHASDLDPYLLAGASEPSDAVPDIKWEFALSAAAEPPTDKFVLLSEIDLQFKLSWMHTRTDIQDQSASSYDLALATRALAASWEPQEVVNLLIAHRRKHGEDLKLRKDYYARTLSKAMGGKAQEARKQLVEDMKAGKPLPETVSKDPAELLAVVSDRLGIAITKVVRYRGESNTYQMELNQRTINVATIDIFDSQTAFRRMVLDHTDHRIPSFNAAAWGNIVSTVFRAVENVDVSIASNRGAFENYIEMYLTGSSNVIGTEDKWQEACLMGRPFLHKGGIWITTQSFMRFILNGTGSERMTTQTLSFTMTKLGYIHEQKRVRHRNGTSTSRSCWRVREAPEDN